MLSINIAGQGIDLICPEVELEHGLSGKYQSWLRQGPCALRIRLEVGADLPARGENPAPAVTFQQGRLALAYEPGGSCYGEIDVAAGDAWLRLDRARNLNEVDYFLRLASALLAFERGGFLVHAAGVLRRGQACLFTGRSGSGKTTIARCSPLDQVLNDDLVVLLPAAQGWQAYSTPFWHPGQVQPAAHSAPLAGIFCLRQDRRVYLEALSPAQALAQILTNIPVVNGDPGRASQLVERVMDLLKDVPVFWLHFLPDHTFWQVIEPLIS